MSVDATRRNDTGIRRRCKVVVDPLGQPIDALPASGRVNEFRIRSNRAFEQSAPPRRIRLIPCIEVGPNDVVHPATLRLGPVHTHPLGDRFWGQVAGSSEGELSRALLPARSRLCSGKTRCEARSKRRRATARSLHPQAPQSSPAPPTTCRSTSPPAHANLCCRPLGTSTLGTGLGDTFWGCRVPPGRLSARRCGAVECRRLPYRSRGRQRRAVVAGTG